MRGSIPHRIPASARTLLIWVESLAYVCLALASAIFAPGLFGTLDNFFSDTMARLNVRGTVPDKVVIADINDDSLAAVGQWPWPRYQVARLLQNLATGSPDVIGVDILFAEPDRTSLRTVRDAFSREFGLDLRVSGIPEGMENNDAFLGAVLARSRSVLPVFDLLDRPPKHGTCAPPPLRIDGGESLRPPEARDFLCNIPEIQVGATTTGFINVTIDVDGMVRRLPLIHRIDGQDFPSLPLAVFMLSQYVTTAKIEETSLGPVLVVGSARVPIDRTGAVRLRFDAPAGAHRHLAADEVLRHGIPANSLQGRIVILGASATGLNDVHHTPISPAFSGSEIYAVLLDNLFDNTFYREPAFASAYQFGVTILASVLMGLLFLRATPVHAALGATGLVAVFPMIGAIAFFGSGLIVPVACPALAVAAQFAMLSVSLYDLEQRQAVITLKRLVRAQHLTLGSMTAVAEGHDELGGAHIKRTQNYVRELALELCATGNYPILDTRYIELLFSSSPLHDIGKVGIPDQILFKAGPLTPEEFAVMQEHVPRGQKIIASVRQDSADEDFLKLAEEIVATHHEKWDGSGYPLGLRGGEIPLSGRIMALADVYDALTSVRHYKPAYSHEKTRAIIIENRGTHFDPAIVDAFLARELSFQRIHQEYYANVSVAQNQERS